jgi:hypothetical protein
LPVGIEAVGGWVETAKKGASLRFHLWGRSEGYGGYKRNQVMACTIVGPHLPAIFVAQ